MTPLLARIKATGEPIAHLARRAEVSRGALSNVAHGRKTFSRVTMTRVLDVIEDAERSRYLDKLSRQTGERAIRSKWEEDHAAIR